MNTVQAEIIFLRSHSVQCIYRIICAVYTVQAVIIFLRSHSVQSIYRIICAVYTDCTRGYHLFKKSQCTEHIQNNMRSVQAVIIFLRSQFTVHIHNNMRIVHYASGYHLFKKTTCTVHIIIYAVYTVHCTSGFHLFKKSTCTVHIQNNMRSVHWLYKRLSSF